MRDNIKKYWFPALGFGVSLLSALFWVALRINHSGISKFMGADTNPSFLIMNLPVMVCVLAWMGCGLSLWGLVCWQKRKWPGIAGFVIGTVMTVAAVAVIYFGAKDYLRFILPHFWKSVGVSACVITFSLLLFFPIQGKNKLKAVIVALVVLAAVVIGYQLRPCSLTCEAVVYAVEDDYQIVFATSDNAIAWVNIGGKEYYDLYAGSMQSSDKVHKITVPQKVLDEADAYAINFRQVIYRGPFGGYLGELQTRHYPFRPVNTADGLDYFALSDVHEAVDAATRAATARENMDFIVLLGDIVSMVETEADALLTGQLAHAITGGEIPVIYARGNHEIKGEYGERLHKYVGARGEEFYYTVTLGDDVFAVVLDLGEDHEDDWWEYYTTAKFDLYRQEQTEMLEEILADGDYEDYRYRMAICHIPVVYVDDEGLFASFREEWTTLLNEIDVDICLSGHQHKLYQFLPGAVKPYETLVYAYSYSGVTGKVEGSYLTDFNFPSFLVGRRSLEQKGGTSSGYDAYVGMAVSVDFETGRQVSQYINSEREIITGYYPFAGDYPGITFSSILTYTKRQEK